MFLDKIKEGVRQDPRKLFLADGYGALLSSFIYSMVMSNYENVFGMPQKVAYILGGLAGIYAVYSFSCYLIRMANWKPYLKIIALANLFHCGLVVGLIINYFPKISTLGFIYFVGEIIIVVSLGLYELKIAKK